jgi:hypothetical protein
VIYDTLKLARSLRDKAYFTTEQAEGLAEALNEAAQGDLATKSDLKAEIAAVKAEIAAVRGELKADISELKAELLKYMAAQTLAIIIAVAAMVHFLR